FSADFISSIPSGKGVSSIEGITFIGVITTNPFGLETEVSLSWVLFNLRILMTSSTQKIRRV
ncbi:MAG: hypothetical protein WA125_10445, partial [Desulfosporosinus sp.]